MKSWTFNIFDVFQFTIDNSVNAQLVPFWLVRAPSSWLLKDPRSPLCFPCFLVKMMFQTHFVYFWP